MPSVKLIPDRAPRFVLLLVLILAELMFVPFFVGTAVSLHVAQFVTILLLVAALAAAGGQGASVLLFVLTIVAHILAAYFGTVPMQVIALLLRCTFIGYVTGLIMWHTLRQKDVTVDTIAGAACAYAMLAVLWANLYVLLELVHPGSFQIPAIWLNADGGDPRAGLAYFSFVTLTTVGYGDITPAWPGAGGLAATEAVVGQLYLAITIARLVSLHAAKRSG